MTPPTSTPSAGPVETVAPRAESPTAHGENRALSLLDESSTSASHDPPKPLPLNECFWAFIGSRTYEFWVLPVEIQQRLTKLAQSEPAQQTGLMTDVVGRSLTEFLHPDDAALLRGNNDALMDLKNMTGHQVTCRTPRLPDAVDSLINFPEPKAQSPLPHPRDDPDADDPLDAESTTRRFVAQHYFNSARREPPSPRSSDTVSLVDDSAPPSSPSGPLLFSGNATPAQDPPSRADSLPSSSGGSAPVAVASPTIIHATPGYRDICVWLLPIDAVLALCFVHIGDVCLSGDRVCPRQYDASLTLSSIHDLEMSEGWQREMEYRLRQRQTAELEQDASMEGRAFHTLEGPGRGERDPRGSDKESSRSNGMIKTKKRVWAPSRAPLFHGLDLAEPAPDYSRVFNLVSQDEFLVFSYPSERIMRSHGLDLAPAIGKPTLALFTASDWTRWCHAMRFFRLQFQMRMTGRDGKHGKDEQDGAGASGRAGDYRDPKCDALIDYERHQLQLEGIFINNMLLYWHHHLGSTYGQVRELKTKQPRRQLPESLLASGRIRYQDPAVQHQRTPPRPIAPSSTATSVATTPSRFYTALAAHAPSVSWTPQGTDASNMTTPSSSSAATAVDVTASPSPSSHDDFPRESVCIPFGRYIFCVTQRYVEEKSTSMPSNPEKQALAEEDAPSPHDLPEHTSAKTSAATTTMGMVPTPASSTGASSQPVAVAPIDPPSFGPDAGYDVHTDLGGGPDPSFGVDHHDHSLADHGKDSTRHSPWRQGRQEPLHEANFAGLMDSLSVSDRSGYHQPAYPPNHPPGYEMHSFSLDDPPPRMSAPSMAPRPMVRGPPLPSMRARASTPRRAVRPDGSPEWRPTDPTDAAILQRCPAHPTSMATMPPVSHGPIIPDGYRLAELHDMANVRPSPPPHAQSLLYPPSHPQTLHHPHQHSYTLAPAPVPPFSPIAADLPSYPHHSPHPHHHLHALPAADMYAMHAAQPDPWDNGSSLGSSHSEYPSVPMMNKHQPVRPSPLAGPPSHIGGDSVPAPVLPLTMPPPPQFGITLQSEPLPSPHHVGPVPYDTSKAYAYVYRPKHHIVHMMHVPPSNPSHPASAAAHPDPSIGLPTLRPTTPPPPPPSSAATRPNALPSMAVSSAVPQHMSVPLFSVGSLTLSPHMVTPTETPMGTPTGITMNMPLSASSSAFKPSTGAPPEPRNLVCGLRGNCRSPWI
ncbi:hypothetical protein CXG81DRAFT_16816 [Caulochytrium protostelioides]|uniref:Uncharacterized protein n=1 Tax=Caulochytrium protostelioides TaxID=1555241 RepID=A0A4P9XF10_9FUNG|nr:hypothetical protein CXG81DRAFT_16816 [Caulochytrium protostelioides]|eukprot:RKP03720.1 hypothetical protein CXG81DRAFT_16816 [Caulochytrium protostelioides]